MKTVLFDIAKAVRWTISLGNKFIRVVPALTVLAVICSMLSQFFLLAGFLLPLKVVLLLGSESVPAYFPEFMHDFGRDGLVLLLSIASVLFYLGHLVTGKLVDRFAILGGKRLLSRSKKLAIFENQEDIASKGYQRYTQSLAALCFVVACLAVMTIFYSGLVGVIVVYIALGFTITVMLTSVSGSFRSRVYGAIGPTAKLVTSIGFLVVFGFIVFDHLVGDAPDLLFSVIALLLTRQLFGRASNVPKDVQGLYLQKAKLSALFFHAQAFRPDKKKADNGFWAMVEPKTSQLWIEGLLRQIIGGDVSRFQSSWFYMGLADVICYDVTVAVDSGARSFLIKLFNSNRSTWAKHEATLITTSMDLPSLPLVLVAPVDRFSCHVFETTGYTRCGRTDFEKKDIAGFVDKLSALEIPEDLQAAYLRSHSQVWQRFDKSQLLRIEYLLGEDADTQVLEQFREHLPGMLQDLQSLPLAITMPDPRPAMLWKDTAGYRALAHWSLWSLEPLGARWSFSSADQPYVMELLGAVRSSRSDAESVSFSQVRLSALFSEFEGRLNKGRYSGAYNLIPLMLSLYDSEPD